MHVSTDEPPGHRPGHPRQLTPGPWNPRVSRHHSRREHVWLALAGSSFLLFAFLVPMKLPTPLVALVLSGAVTPAIVASADWSHIMGPQFDRKTADAAQPWSASGPRQVWKISASGGFSSFVTGDGRAYTVVPLRAGGDLRETVIAIDRKSGAELWKTPLGEAEYEGGGERGADGNTGGDGPRATPVFADGRVFVFGGS